MRIAFAFEGSLPSPQADAEVFMHTAAALSRRGHDVSFLFPRRSGLPDAASQIIDHYQIEGSVRIVPVPNPFERKTAQHGWQALRVPWTDEYRQCEVLYTRNTAILATAMRGRVPVFYDHYRPLPDQTPLLQPLLRSWMTHPRFLGMACHSDLARKSFLRIGVPPERLKVVHNGFDPTRMIPELSLERARDTLGWDRRRPTVVYTGRINQGKGLGVVFAMARALPEVDFVLVGAAGDGNPTEREAGAIDNVRLVPWQAPRATVPYLYAADVLLIPPSRRPLEEFGRTVLPLKVFLYLASGRPVLAGNTPDVREVLHHAKNAWLVEPGNVAEATEAVKKLCGDAELAAKLSARAKADSKTLTWDARAERLDAFLTERLSAPRVRDVASGWSVGPWLRECIRG